MDGQYWFEKGRGILIVKRSDESVTALLKDDGKMRVYIFGSIDDFINATKGVFEKDSTIPGIYFVAVGSVFVFTKRQIKQFMKIAKNKELV